MRPTGSRHLRTTVSKGQGGKPIKDTEKSSKPIGDRQKLDSPSFSNLASNTIIAEALSSMLGIETLGSTRANYSLNVDNGKPIMDNLYSHLRRNSLGTEDQKLIIAFIQDSGDTLNARQRIQWSKARAYLTDLFLTDYRSMAHYMGIYLDQAICQVRDNHDQKLQKSITHPYPDKLEQLLKKNPLLARTPQSYGHIRGPHGYSAMHLALDEGKADHVAMLLDNGADPHETIDGRALLYKMAYARVGDGGVLRYLDNPTHARIVTSLLDKGSPLDARTRTSLLTFSSSTGKTKTLKRLNPTATEIDDHNLLYDAAKRGDLETVTYLVEKGGNPNKDWLTAYDVANTFNHQDVMDYLRPFTHSMLRIAFSRLNCFR